MNNNLYIALIVFLLAALACTHLYESFDSRLHPAPEISKDAQLGLQRSGGEATLVFLGNVEKTEVALLYYSCKFPDGWRVDRTVYDVYPQDGKIVHRREANCPGRMRIIMKAYNNFNKRTQKSAQMGWEFNTERLMNKSVHRI